MLEGYMQHNKNVDQLSVRSKQNKKSYFNKKKRERSCMHVVIDSSSFLTNKTRSVFHMPFSC